MILPKKSVIEMEPYNPPKEGRRGKLRLDFNENTLGCSPKVLKVMKNVNYEDLAVYPEYLGLRNKLAKYMEVRRSEIMPVNATDEAIMCVMNTYVDNGDEVVIPVPTFALFKFYASIAGAEIREIMYNRDLTFPTEGVMNAINKNTKIVVLVNPNNPTGSAIPDEDIIKIVEKAKKYGSLVLIDEAYYEFYGKTSKGLVKKYGNVIVTRTFSKAFGLAGIRLGYVVSDEKNIRNLSKACSPYSISSIAVNCAFAALEDVDFVKRYVKEIARAKKIMIRRLKALGIKTYPTSANFLLTKFGENASEICKKLKERGVLVRDRTGDPLLAGCLRIGIGTLKQTGIFLKALRAVLNEMKDEAILLDMDGVLVDVSKSYRTAVKKTAEYFLGRKILPDEIQAVKNESGYNNDWDCTMEIIRRNGKVIEKQEAVKKFQGLYLGKKFDGLIRNEKWLMNKQILENFSKKYSLGIVTGRPRKEAFYVLKKEGLEKFFGVVIAMEDIPRGKGKPDPYGLKKAMKALRAKRAWYFGDTVDDMKAAAKAGIIGVGILPPRYKGRGMRKLLSENGAVIVIENINQLGRIMK